MSVGIRPHDFTVAEPAAAVATLKVELVEALGFEAFAYGWLRASGPRIVARLEAADAKRVKAGDSLPLGVAAAEGAPLRPGHRALSRCAHRVVTGP